MLCKDQINKIKTKNIGNGCKVVKEVSRTNLHFFISLLSRSVRVSCDKEFRSNSNLKNNRHQIFVNRKRKNVMYIVAILRILQKLCHQYLKKTTKPIL